MDLLPKNKGDFKSKAYWEGFFKKRGLKAFEWYGEYNELCGILHKYVKTTDKVLVVGCGNSRLSCDLYDVGYRQMTNIDISDTAIAQMKSQNETKRPDMPFIKMDATEMDFNDGRFGVVLDKGTLDALMPDSEESTTAIVDKMFSEIDRVLRIGGRYMCVTLAQSHVLAKVLIYFHNLGWMTRACRVPDKEDKDAEFYLPVFVLVFTKLKKMPNLKPLIEVSNFEDTVERLEDTEQLEKAIESMQQYSIIRRQLQAKQQLDEQISLDLYSNASLAPRYTLHIVDSTKKYSNKFAIFIVPEGRETEWLFSDDAGRRELSKSAGFERLVVVTLNRDHQYLEGLDGIKQELSSKVMELAPPNLKAKQVPFLSIGNDINTRLVRHRGTSVFSGDYVVEDVDNGELSMRRLIFLNNPSIVQTEMRLIKSGKKKTTMKPNPDYLTFPYYKNMIAGLAFLQDFEEMMKSDVEVLLVGLGGGSLAMYLQKHFPSVQLEVVELDPAVVQIAKDWYGLQESERLKIIVEDGIPHIKKLGDTPNKKHVIIIDVDSKDLTQGMSCPPPAFIATEFLKIIDTVLHPQGLLIMNLVCRNSSLKTSVIADLKSVFKSVYRQSNEEETNEILYALPSTRQTAYKLDSDGQLPKELADSVQLLQNGLQSKTVKAQSKSTDINQLTTVLNDLKLL